MFRPLGLRALRPAVRPQFRSTILPSLLRPAQFLRYQSSIRIQKVRIRQRRFTWKRFVTFGLYTGASYYILSIWLHALLGPLDDEEEYEAHGTDDLEKARRRALMKAMDRSPGATSRRDGEHNEEEGNKEDENEDKDEDEDEDEDEEDEWEDEESIFIPMTLASPCPRQFYRGTDPEWQEYKKFAKDKNKRKNMELNIVNTLRSHAARHQQLAPALGQVDFAKGRVWLDLSFPMGPPREFERSGIEIAFLDDSIAILWSTKTMSEREKTRLERVLFPWGTCSALLASTTKFGRERWSNLKQLFGGNDVEHPPQPVSLADQLAKASTRMQDAQKKTSKPGDAAESAGPGRVTSSSQPSMNDSSTKAEVGWGPSSTKGWFTGEIQTLKKNYLLRNRPVIADPPRGSVRVAGWIEVWGTKGVCTLDVLAHYDPKSEKIVELHSGVRRLSAHRIPPRG